MPETKNLAGTLIKTSLVDFPGLVSCAVFLAGCNLRCPYCYNTNLVTGNLSEDEAVTLEEIFLHLEKRKSVLKGLVLSGGEALLNPATPELIRKAKSLGYKIKLDTNGTLPHRLSDFFSDTELRPDYVAMDLKCSSSKVHHLLGKEKDEMCGALWEKITESARIISSLPKDRREWRTVLVPGLVEKDDIKEMASILPEDADWYFAHFQNGACLDEGYSTLQPYSQTEEEDILSHARTFIPGAALR